MENIITKKQHIAIDLFCGCGGVTEGLKQAGFTVAAAVDNDPVCCQTYRLNHPEVQLIEKDILKTSAQSLKRILGGQKLDLLVICAPCQPFSRLNKSTAPDSRVYLILQAIRFARALRPKHIFFENVPGLAKNNSVIEQLTSQLKELGYHLTGPQQIDAADYEVPQRRMRCVIVASRKSAVTLPVPITPSNHRVTVRQAIGDLPVAKFRNKADPLHVRKKHSEIALQRLSHIPRNGGGRSSLPDELVLSCHQRLKEDGKDTYYSDVYGRMFWDDVAPTLTTGCTDITKGRYAHPSQNRAITLREAALLQTFPLNYCFFGNPSQIARQIGNAVPVNLAKNLVSIFLVEGG